MTKEQAIQHILDSVKEYHKTFMQKPPYKDGDRIPYASRVYDKQEMVNLVDSSLEFWLMRLGVETWNLHRPTLTGNGLFALIGRLVPVLQI